MSVEDTMTALLAKLGENLAETIKEQVTAMKDGVEFVAPVSDEQVADVKQKMANALSARFKRKEVEELPNFTKMFLDQEEGPRDRFKEVWLDPNHCEGRYGHTSNKESRTLPSEICSFNLPSDQKSEKHKLNKVFIAQKVLNEGICRETLITILGETADKLSAESREMLNKEDLRTRLDDLIHNNHMTAVHQSIRFNEPELRKESEARTRSVLKLFAESDTIKTFLVDDLFKRAQETIKNVMHVDFADFGIRNVKLSENFRSLVKLEAILDPANLILLSKNFMEFGYISDEKLPECIVTYVDLCMVYALMFISD